MRDSERWKRLGLVLMSVAAPILVIDNVVRAFDDPTVLHVVRAVAWCAVLVWAWTSLRSDLRRRKADLP